MVICGRCSAKVDDTYVPGGVFACVCFNCAHPAIQTLEFTWEERCGSCNSDREFGRSHEYCHTVAALQVDVSVSHQLRLVRLGEKDACKTFGVGDLAECGEKSQTLFRMLFTVQTPTMWLRGSRNISMSRFGASGLQRGDLTPQQMVNPAQPINACGAIFSNLRNRLSVHFVVRTTEVRNWRSRTRQPCSWSS